MIIRCASFLALGMVLVGCGIKVPVAVISQNGDIMRGYADTGMGNGSFQASGRVAGKELTCSGSYNSFDTSVTISIPVFCSDGRKGIVIATREASGLSGSGRVRLNDGTEADFVFGNAAKAF